MLPDLSSLGAEVLGSAAAEANSTLIGLLQVAQAAMNSRSVTRTFSRQFSKRYLARWNDKTGLKVRGACRIESQEPSPFLTRPKPPNRRWWSRRWRTWCA